MFTRAAAYTLKIILFSALAAVPVLLIRAPLTTAAAPLPRTLQNLIPFLASAALFALIGILLLAATRDRNIRLIIRRKK
jgi:putative peptidoglycan lipid II flippase